MGLFGKNKKDDQEPKAEKLEETLRDDISKAYDELTKSQEPELVDVPQLNEDEKQAAEEKEKLQAEVLKLKINLFKEKQTQEALVEVVKLLPQRQFLLPSTSNIKEPFVQNDGKIKLKKGAVIKPALLQGSDGKTFLPVFTDDGAMTQKSPSGVVLKFVFEQCVSIVYDKKNPVSAIVINPFTENLILNEELLRQIFKEKTRENNAK